MKIRRAITIKGRSSSIANAFVHALIPDVEEVRADYKEAVAILGMSPENLSCVYCGSATTDWDHFRPLVRAERPTGYGHGARNLVPSCGPCNQSKGGKEWRTWMLGQSPNSPKSRSISDLESRVERLEQFEAWTNLAPVDFMSFVSPEVWDRYWERLRAIKVQLVEAQRDADAIRAEIVLALAQSKLD